MNPTYQTFREELTYILLKLFQKNYRLGNIYRLFLQGHNHPDNKTRQRQHTKKENYRQISLMNIDTKILNKILANRIQQHIKKLIYHDQVEFILRMQGWFNDFRSINVLYHFTKIEEKAV